MAAKVLVVDNYDSFVYNLVQYLGQLGADPVVRRNDELSVTDVAELRPSGIVVSPGPGRPEDAGISVPLIRALAGQAPILGVCLGHQAIGQATGARIVRAERLMHGKTDQIHHDGRTLYAGMPNPFTATRYHSLLIKRDTLPETLEITAETKPEGEIMGIRHKKHPIWGVQFHPESILTQEGKMILSNFLNLTK